MMDNYITGDIVVTSDDVFAVVDENHGDGTVTLRIPFHDDKWTESTVNIRHYFLTNHTTRGV